jgi:O-antigen/teichoic acid export membrane protein
MAPDRESIVDFLQITTGTLGRLVISLVYFLIVANTLSVADFGLFAAAAAVGLVLSRLLGFGYISPVYRAATVKPRLLGVHLAGLAVLSTLSLAPIAAAGTAVHWAFFDSRVGLGVFALIVAAEVLGARVMEFAAITLNGLSRFAPAARLVILASALRTAAALAFLFAGWRSLEAWAWLNLAAALGGAALGLFVFMPRVVLRMRPKLYPRRLKDAVLTAASEIAFYAQGELDKVVVLALAGDRAAGVYAIAMRLIDLTAIPVRSFSQLLAQRTMRDRSGVIRPARQAAIEAAVAAVSIGGLAGLIAIMQLAPDGAFGGNIGRAAPVLPLLILIPAFRNLIEIHGDMLYAREIVFGRLATLLVLMGLKFGLMAALIDGAGGAQVGIEAWALQLNGVFAAVYAASALATYGLIRARRSG